MNKNKIVVVKVGTSTLTRGTKKLDKAHMLEVVRAIANLKKQDYKIILVTSGAVAAGREVLNNPDLPKTLSSKQMLASVGQGKLMEIYESLFSIYGIHIGQILLTRADLETRDRYLNARDALFALLDNNIIPIINENDAVSTQEIKVGDNDNMAALTGILVDAHMVILLTDQKGLYDKNPSKYADAKLISKVDKITDEVMQIAGGSSTTLGTGGMSTKVKAANIAMKAGISLVIASGDEPSIIESLVEENGVGTYFVPSLSPMQAKKLWLVSANKEQGYIYVDDGARDAILHKGSSLLPSGIISVEGDFNRGSYVKILDKNKEVLSSGLTRYSLDEIEKIKGHNSKDIEDLLGYSHGNVVIHRDEMVIAE